MMSDQNIQMYTDPKEPVKGFEGIKHLDGDGIEYWYARELVDILEYTEWRNFEKVIEKAKQGTVKSGQTVEYHFVDLNKVIEAGKGAKHEINDWKLSRYACYLIAQNADSSKKPVALAQTYFAVQTRKQEVFQDLADTEKRLLIRQKMIDENKRLFETAQKAGVSRFGTFNDHGYKGLYGMTVQEIKKHKNIDDALLDRAGSTELAANLFRVTQTEEKLRKEKTNTERDANLTHFQVGGKIRKAIKDIGGELPENIKPEKNIKEVEKELKAVGALDETMERISKTETPKTLGE